MTRPEFAVHMLTDEGKARAQAIAAAFDELLDRLEALCPAGREFAITKTKLEEACFFAKKAMAAVNTVPEEASCHTVVVTLNGRAVALPTPLTYERIVAHVGYPGRTDVTVTWSAPGRGRLSLTRLNAGTLLPEHILAPYDGYVINAMLTSGA